MTNRTQCFNWNGTQSDNLGISIDVAQGALLEPLFFIHNPDCQHYSSAHMYANDTTQDASDKCIDIIEYKLHRDLIVTLEWMNKNNHTINLKIVSIHVLSIFKKTLCMVIGTEQRLKNCRNLSIQVDSVVIENVSCAKRLGVYIYKCLTWSEDVVVLSKKKLLVK